MSTFGKPNATGRSSGKLNRREDSLLGPPPGAPWVWTTRELLESAAWRRLSKHGKNFVEALMIEHTNHAGRENGRLAMTYDQLVRFGIPRKRIAAAIREAVVHGLVEVTRRGGLYGVEAKRTTSLYRLTWIGCLNPERPATNEWRRYQLEKNVRVTHGGTVSKAKSAKEAA